MRTLTSWAALTLNTPMPTSRNLNSSHPTPTLPSSWTVTPTESKTWNHLDKHGGAGIPSRRQAGWLSTSAPGRHRDALGASTVFMPWKVPVGRTDAAHTLPLTYLAHVADRLSYHLGGDPGYTGLITRNPVTPGPECTTFWARMFPYTLRELDKLLPNGKPPSRRLTGIGRNCDMFRSMVSEVFRPRWAAILGAQGWTEAWLEHVRGQNAAMFAPDVLPDSECRSIAKSCFRYWTLNYDPGRFSEIQTRRNGKRRHGDFAFDFDHQAEDVRQLKSWGLKQSTIGAVVGLSQARVSQILSQGL